MECDMDFVEHWQWRHQSFQMMTPWMWRSDLMFDLCDLARGILEVRNWITGIKGRSEYRGFWGCTLGILP